MNSKCWVYNIAVVILCLLFVVIDKSMILIFVVQILKVPHWKKMSEKMAINDQLWDGDGVLIIEI